MELIGIQDKVEEIKEWLTEWRPEGKRTLLLNGPPGVGKTESVYVVANMTGKTIAEFNASDDRSKDFLNQFKLAVYSKPLSDVIYLLDEADNIDDKEDLLEILTTTENPIIMTANEPWKLGQLRYTCSEIRFYRPNIEDVVRNAERNKVEDKRAMPRDHRQALMKRFNSEGYDTQTLKERMEYMLSTGDYSDLDFNSSRDYWRLLRESSKFYGKDLYLFIKSLAVAQKCRRYQPMEAIK